MKRLSRFTALLICLALFASFGLTGCGKTEKEEKKPEEKKQSEVQIPSVSGSCYVMAGMTTEGEEYDEELLKEIFGIKQISDYISVFFKEDGKVYIQSMIYAKNVVTGTWKQDGSTVTAELSDQDGMDFDVREEGTIETVLEQEDGDFTLTLVKTDDFPEKLAEYK